MRRALAIVPAAVGVLLLSGCGDPTAPGSGPGAPTTATASPTTPAPSATGPSDPGSPVLPGTPSGKPSASGPRLVLDGIVEAGVEPGCKVLTSPTGQYLLLGGKDVPMGVPVRVTGVPVTGVSSTCQQGTPLRVLDVQRR